MPVRSYSFDDDTLKMLEEIKQSMINDLIKKEDLNDSLVLRMLIRYYHKKHLE